MARARGARVIAMGRNAGFAAAVNRGISEAAHPLVAILNTDVELAPDYLEKLAAVDAAVRHRQDSQSVGTAGWDL